MTRSRSLRGYLSSVLTVVLAACSSSTSASGNSNAGSPANSVTVVAAFYPLAWLARQIGTDHVVVRDLTPAGAEPHDIEIDADGVDAAQQADVAIVMGRGFQPAVEAAAKGRRAGTVSILDQVLNVNGDDPHVWLDPVMMDRMATGVAKALAAAKPALAPGFNASLANLHTQLTALDAEYHTVLSTCRRKDLVTSHEAFGRLASRYGLHQEGIAGFSPDAEPDPKRMAKLADLVKQRGVTTIFTEELLPTKLADTLARETGATTAVLSPLESLTVTQKAVGGDYLSVMKANLALIRTALGCS